MQTELCFLDARPSGFHTYMAKLAAISQAIFLVLAFFLPQPIVWLFYVAIGITALQLKKEIMLVRMLPQWRGNIKSLWWVCGEQRKLNK
ncbi:MAG: hypothetical protein IPM85_17390 [Chitinophagaceae bacterium]|nr:hypothetical protein [Chitinophagaceae bacterium]